MKEISFYLDDSSIVEVKDDDPNPLNDYSAELSAILEYTNVVTIETSECNVILRPSRINLIKVKEYERIEDITILKSEESKSDENEVVEDMIVDG